MLVSTQLGRSDIAQHNFAWWTGKNYDLSDGGIRATIVIVCVIPGVYFVRLHIASMRTCVRVCRSLRLCILSSSPCLQAIQFVRSAVNSYERAQIFLSTADVTFDKSLRLANCPSTYAPFFIDPPAPISHAVAAPVTSTDTQVKIPSATPC